MAGRALVIGANGGMGMAVVRVLLKSSWHVSATVSRSAAVDLLRDEFPQCDAVVALDLSDANAVKEEVSGIVATIGELHAVVVCAAVAPFGPAETTKFEIFRRTMEINCLSNLAIYQACLPALRRTRGRLVLTGSYSGKVATPVMASYVSSKFALEGLADVLRQEAGAWGVDVILLQPGALDTQMMRRSQASLAATIADLAEDEAALYGTLYRQMKYRADEGIASGLFTHPDVLAATVIEALTATGPEARYPVGDDALQMVEMARTKTDREIDQVVLDIYRSAPLGEP